MNPPAPGPGRFARLPELLLAVSLAAIGTLGVWSRDVGFHWDEGRLTESIQASFESGLMLPHWYSYPSLAYDLGVLTALPRALPDAVRGFRPHRPRTGSPEIVKELGGAAFNLRLRAVFVLLCTLTGLAVFLLARRLSGDPWAALFAALVTLTSWEFFYHARWIAPDGLVMLFAAFSMWTQCRVLESGRAAERRRWVVWAAVFAGLATGAKYPGAVALLALLLAIVLAPRGAEAVRFGRLRDAALALLIASATFVVTTPGMLLEPALFARDLIWEAFHYQSGHPGHTVGAGGEHFSLLVRYLGTVMLSRQPFLATLVAALALAGAVDLARRRGRVALWMLFLPVVFVAYLSSLRVMIVRNDLLLLPPLAALAGVGFAAVRRATAGAGTLRRTAGTAAALLVLFDFAGIARSARSVVVPNRSEARTALERWIRSTPGVRYYLSPYTRLLAQGSDVLPSPNVVAVMDSADRFIFYSIEISEWELRAANVPGRYRTVWQVADDVNWDYYPDWEGHHRLLDIRAPRSPAP